MSRKSSGHKVVTVGGAEVPRGGRTLAVDHMTENVEALVPMISAHFIDAKVRQMQDTRCTSEEHTNQFTICILMTSYQGAAEMVLNSSGPVHSMNQTERWLLFNRDMMGPVENDVSLVLVKVDVHFGNATKQISHYLLIVQRHMLVSVDIGFWKL